MTLRFPPIPRLAPYLLASGVLLSACGEEPATTPPTPPLERPARFFTDDTGRALILHGFNVESAAKGSAQAGDHQPRLSEREVEIARNEWGFTLMRHLIFWGAIEPTMGSYDEAYLDAVEERLDWYAAHGVRCTLDMHQDLYSWQIGGYDTGGNGFPLWAAMTTNQDPIMPTTPWSLVYFHPRVTEAFDNFWSYAGPYRMLQDRYAAAWVHVAERFRDHPAVLGYDLINESFPGSDLDGAEPGEPQLEAGSSYRFDREELAPFYQRVIDAIRTVDDDTWILYQGRFGAPGEGSPNYLPRLHDPRAGEDRLAQSPHLYSIAYENFGVYEPADDRTLERWEAVRATEMRDHDTPMLCGEWGLDQTFPGADLYTEKLLTMADRMMIGWTYWSWDSDGSWSAFDRTGDPLEPFAERPLMDRLVRVYPLAIAGRPVEYDYDPATRIFRLVFDDVEGVTYGNTTEIFVPVDRIYPEGYYVSLSDPFPINTVQSFDASTNTLSIQVDTLNADRHVIVIGPR